MNGLTEIERANLNASIKHFEETERHCLNAVINKTIEGVARGTIEDLSGSGEFIRFTFSDGTVLQVNATSPCDNVDIEILNK